MTGLKIGDIIEGKLNRYPHFYEKTCIDNKKMAAFMLWNIGKYFDKQTKQVLDLIQGQKYKLDTKGYIVKIGYE